MYFCKTLKYSILQHNLDGETETFCNKCDNTGIYIGIYIIEMMFGFGMYYHNSGPDGFYWILLRLFYLGSYLFLIISSNRLRPLYQDKHFKVFYKILLSSFILSCFFTLLTLVNLGSHIYYEFDKYAVLLYQSGILINYILYFVALLKYTRFVKQKKKKLIFRLAATVSICTLLGVFTIQTFQIFDIIYYFHPYFMSWDILMWYFLYLLILAAVIVFLTSIAHIVLGVGLLMNPILDSEEDLYMKPCEGCNNHISIDVDHCPYCGFVYSVPKAKFSK